LLFQGHQGPILLYGVFTAEKVDGLGDRGSGYTIDIQTLLEAFLGMSLRYSLYINEAFS
jgi:hypothetical protein